MLVRLLIITYATAYVTVAVTWTFVHEYWYAGATVYEQLASHAPAKVVTPVGFAAVALRK